MNQNKTRAVFEDMAWPSLYKCVWWGYVFQLIRHTQLSVAKFSKLQKQRGSRLCFERRRISNLIFQLVKLGATLLKS